MSMNTSDRFGPAAPANHWQDWGNLVLAVWLFISPWVLNFANAAPAPSGVAGPETNASWNAWILAVIIAVVAIAAIARLMTWQQWVNLVLGVWLFISPWVLGFSGSMNAAWDHRIVGVLVALLSIWNLSTVSATEPSLAHAGDRPSPRPGASRDL